MYLIRVIISRYFTIKSQLATTANIVIFDKTEQIHSIAPQTCDSKDYHMDEAEWRDLSRIRERWRQKVRAFPTSNKFAKKKAIIKLLDCWPQAYKPHLQEIINQAREDLTQGFLTETFKEYLVPMLATKLGSLTI